MSYTLSSTCGKRAVSPVGTMDAVPTGDTELSLSRLRSHASVTGSSVITVSNNVTRGVRWKGEVGGESVSHATSPPRVLLPASMTRLQLTSPPSVPCCRKLITESLWDQAFKRNKTSTSPLNHLHCDAGEVPLISWRNNVLGSDAVGPRHGEVSAGM